MLLIGLGNPGEQYDGTYHNVGRETLNFFKETLEKRYPAAALERGKHFHFYRFGPFCLVYPDTFMNESGQAVEAALKWFAVDGDSAATQAVVFHDDSDLALGEYKEAGGGAAGHHGIESIFASLKDASQGVPARVRIGVRDPREKSGEEPRRKAGDFVLKHMTSRDMATLKEKVFAPLAEKFLTASR